MVQTPRTDFSSGCTCTNPKLEAELLLLNIEPHISGDSLAFSGISPLRCNQQGHTDGRLGSPASNKVWTPAEAFLNLGNWDSIRQPVWCQSGWGASGEGADGRVCISKQVETNRIRSVERNRTSWSLLSTFQGFLSVLCLVSWTICLYVTEVH